MPAFSQKQIQPQKHGSSSPARSYMASPGPPHREHPLFHLQSTLGNQAVQTMLRMLPPLAEGAEEPGKLTAEAFPPFGHDFSRIPVDPSAAGLIPPKLLINRPGDEYEQEADRISKQVMRMPKPQLQRACGGGCSRCQTEQPGQAQESLQTKRVQAGGTGQTAAPSIVHHVLAASGQTLDPVTRSFMEPRFGTDFADVRVHTDPGAAESAREIGARAYTVGGHIVFGGGEYAPAIPEGRSLLAYELAHVVQARGASDPQPVLRRAPSSAKTWAGDFIADPYNATSVSGQDDVTVGYGANITITFKPNKLVDAGKIAFIQSVLSVKDGTPDQKYQANATDAKVVSSRTIPTGQTGAGTHIDQFPGQRTPIYGATGSRDESLKGAEPAKFKLLTVIGKHLPGAPDKNVDPVLHDEPDLNTGDLYTDAGDVMTSEWHQQFESAALAIDGNQNGTFYGSVEWGWSKKLTDIWPQLADFKTKSDNVPSAIFRQAAGLWNVSLASDGKPSIQIPAEDALTTRLTPLWDAPDKGKKTIELSAGIPVGQTGKLDPKNRSWWRNVMVIGGPHFGKAGWMLDADSVLRRGVTESAARKKAALDQKEDLKKNRTGADGKRLYDAYVRSLNEVGKFVDGKIAEIEAMKADAGGRGADSGAIEAALMKLRDVRIEIDIESSEQELQWLKPVDSTPKEIP